MNSLCCYFAACVPAVGIFGGFMYRTISPENKTTLASPYPVSIPSSSHLVFLWQLWLQAVQMNRSECGFLLRASNSTVGPGLQNSAPLSIRGCAVWTDVPCAVLWSGKEDKFNVHKRGEWTKPLFISCIIPLRGKATEHSQKHDSELYNPNNHRVKHKWTKPRTAIGMFVDRIIQKSGLKNT